MTHAAAFAASGPPSPAPPRPSLGAHLAVLALVVGMAGQARAQEVAVVGGQVVDSNTSAGISNALVRLDGHGTMLTSPSGSFRFDGVRIGDYTLHVEALGYVDVEMSVRVEGDTVLAVAMSVDPVALDPIDVELGRLDFDGRVRDGTSESNVPDAHVLTDQGHEEWTNVHGRFDLDDVFERVPLRLTIRAFSYMPLDTTFVPDDEERYPFHLDADPLVRRMIDVHVARLDARAAERIYEFQPAVNREDMDRFDSSATLQTVMERFYPLHILRRIGCFFVDEREVRFSSREHAASVIQGTMANDLQRIELYEFPGQARLFMARIYTRRYFQRTVGTDRPMEKPSMSLDGRFCR